MAFAEIFGTHTTMYQLVNKKDLMRRCTDVVQDEIEMSKKHKQQYHNAKSRLGRGYT